VSVRDRTGDAAGSDEALWGHTLDGLFEGYVVRREACLTVASVTFDIKSRQTAARRCGLRAAESSNTDRDPIPTHRIRRRRR
jgi:hypothetical protein